MTIETNLKTIIGEQAFNLCILQDQLEQKTKQIEELQSQLKDKTDVAKPN